MRPASQDTEDTEPIADSNLKIQLAVLGVLVDNYG